MKTAAPIPAPAHLPDHRQDLFADNFVDTLKSQDAAKAMGSHTQDTLEDGLRALADPRVQARIGHAINKRASRFRIESDEVLEKLWAIANADPRDLLQTETGACRCCWGKNHRRQRTPLEYEDHIAAGGKEEGGVGWDPRKPANPNCPECFGRGISSTTVRPVGQMSPGALALCSHIQFKADGPELRLRSQLRALELIARHLGLIGDRYYKPPEDPALKRAQCLEQIHEAEAWVKEDAQHRAAGKGPLHIQNWRIERSRNGSRWDAQLLSLPESERHWHSCMHHGYTQEQYERTLKPHPERQVPKYTGPYHDHPDVMSAPPYQKAALAGVIAEMEENRKAQERAKEARKREAADRRLRNAYPAPETAGQDIVPPVVRETHATSVIPSPLSGEGQGGGASEARAVEVPVIPSERSDEGSHLVRAAHAISVVPSPFSGEGQGGGASEARAVEVAVIPSEVEGSCLVRTAHAVTPSPHECGERAGVRGPATPHEDASSAHASAIIPSPFPGEGEGGGAHAVRASAVIPSPFSGEGQGGGASEARAVEVAVIPSERSDEGSCLVRAAHAVTPSPHECGERAGVRGPTTPHEDASSAHASAIIPSPFPEEGQGGGASEARAVDVAVIPAKAGIQVRAAHAISVVPSPFSGEGQGGGAHAVRAVDVAVDVIPSERSDEESRLVREAHPATPPPPPPKKHTYAERCAAADRARDMSPLDVPFELNADEQWFFANRDRQPFNVPPRLMAYQLRAPPS